MGSNVHCKFMGEFVDPVLGSLYEHEAKAGHMLEEWSLFKFMPTHDKPLKRQTIRRKDQDVELSAGDTLVLCALSVSGAQKIIGKVKVRDVQLVEIRENCIKISDQLGGQYTILSDGAADSFALADGFSDFATMRKWFNGIYGLPFSGVLYTW